VTCAAAPEPVRDARGRRLRDVDRHGTTLTELRWSTEGALTEARVRLPDRTWLTIAPRATTDAPWGLSDVLVHDDTSLTAFRALDWAAIDAIPPLAEPARLPPGAGTAVLNLVAALAADQGRDRVRYDGPYPTEQLFLALLESFRYIAAADDDPLVAFMAGDLAWTPAPHVRLFDPRSVYVQLRGRIEKVVASGRAYYRADWQSVRRRAPRRVHDARSDVRCSLWALGTPLEDHVVLDADGNVLDLLTPPPADAPAIVALPRPVVDALLALVAAGSAPPLRDHLRAAVTARHLEWGPVAGDLLAADATRVRFANRLRAAIAARLDRAGARAGRAAIGLAALGEMALLAGDDLRSRAQAALAAAPRAEQARALAATEAPVDAAAVSAGVEALLAQLLE
jgi:hypothetical protein